MIKSEKSLAYFYFWGELISLFFTFCISFYFFHEGSFLVMEWIFLPIIIVLWFIIGYSRKLYLWNLNKGFLSRSFSFTKSYFILVSLVSLIFLVFNFPVDFSNIIIAFFLGFLIMGITTNFFIDIIISLINKKRSNTKYTLVAGVGYLADCVEKQMNSNNSYHKQHQISGFIKSKKEVAVVREEKVIGDVEDLNQYLNENQIDEIIIALPLRTSKRAQKILDIADYHGIRVKYVVDYKGTFGRNCKMTRYGQIDSLNVRQLPLDEKYAAFIKTSFDFVFSSLALLLLSPLFFVIGILIKLDSRGTVFYCPTRVGRGSKQIKIYKFRTMVKNDVSSGGQLSTAKDDPRISKLGRILRKYSLDELPQFINVFLGDMSVVGPRPHRSVLGKQFQESEENYMIRHYFKPGITGWAQVNGWRGPTETKEQKKQRTLHDLWYLENWSFKLDMKIIYLTICGKDTHRDVF